MEKVKVSREVAEAIQYVTSEGFRADSILDAHKRNPYAWHRPGTQALNGLDYGMLKRALEDGYEVDEQETTDYKMKLFYGTEIKILKGINKDIVLPITWFSSDAKKFRIGTKIHLNSSDIGDTWQFVEVRPTPKTPRQMGAQIVRLTQPNARCQVHPIIALHQKEKQQQSTVEELQAELDYELASLHHAISNDDVAEVARSRQRLSEIHRELYKSELEGV